MSFFICGADGIIPDSVKVYRNLGQGQGIFFLIRTGKPAGL
jgi:hypothetical protein